MSLALVYLHNNSLIHRNLSSNNVLLMKDLRAKITDFGMSRFMHRGLTPLTLCPGTQAYMPPESLNDAPQYSPKLDCFSLGVLAIQIVTRKFPNPGPRFETISNPSSPLGVLLQPVPEEKRRLSHLSLIEGSHPFQPLIKKCLSYQEQDRPTSLELCRSIAKLKTSALYEESVHTAMQAPLSRGDVQPIHRQVSCDSVRKDALKLRAVEQSMCNELQEKLEQGERRQKEAEALLSASKEDIKQRDDEVHNLNEKLVAMQEKLAKYESSRLEPVVNKQDTKQISSSKLSWEVMGEAPQEMFRGSSVVLGDSIYCVSGGKRAVLRFNTTNETWSTLPPCRYSHCSLAAVNGRLTAIGGYDFTTTNQLFIFTSNGASGGSWIQRYDAMPTARCSAVSVCTDNKLIVAGGDGSGYNDYLDTVEVISGKWSEVTRLPCPHLSLSAAVTSSGRLYVAGGLAVRGKNATYSCSLADLLLPPARSRFRFLSGTKRAPVWHETTGLPVTQTTLVAFQDNLLAIGGKNVDRKPVADVHKYDRDTDSWKIFVSLKVPRHLCLADVVRKKIVCLGGQGECSIEVADVEKCTMYKL